MKTIAVIFGGRSTEHDISVITALASVIKPLKLIKEYNVLPVYIAKDGAWYSEDVLADISIFTSGKIEDFILKSKPISVQFDGGMTINKQATFGSPKRQKIDIVFPAMHGTYGEDGSLMGLLDMAGVAYVGCGLSASVQAMDKVVAKIIVEAHGIATPKFLHFSRQDVTEGGKEIVTKINQTLHYPLFVKPAHLGSSIGITKVDDENGVANALEVAAYYDDKIVVEEGVSNLTEVTLPIMGNEDPLPALLEQPVLKSEDFFGFDTKYLQGGKKGGKSGGSKGAQGYSKLPAELPEDIYHKAEALGLRVYKALGCSGTARVDMLIDSKSGEVYFNEVNPLPGSLYAHNWRAAGLSGVDLVRKLVEFAEERFNQRQQLATTFTTSYLQQFKQ